jgi:hypothetical protein
MGTSWRSSLTSQWRPVVFRRRSIIADPSDHHRSNRVSGSIRSRPLPGSPFGRRPRSSRSWCDDSYSIRRRVGWQALDSPRVPVGGWFQGAAARVGRGRLVVNEAAMFTAQVLVRPGAERSSPVGGRAEPQFLLSMMLAERPARLRPRGDIANRVDGGRLRGPNSPARISRTVSSRSPARRRSPMKAIEQQQARRIGLPHDSAAPVHLLPHGVHVSESGPNDNRWRRVAADRGPS